MIQTSTRAKERREARARSKKFAPPQYTKSTHPVLNRKGRRSEFKIQQANLKQESLAEMKEQNRKDRSKMKGSRKSKLIAMKKMFRRLFP